MLRSSLIASVVISVSAHVTPDMGPTFGKDYGGGGKHNAQCTCVVVLLSLHSLLLAKMPHPLYTPSRCVPTPAHCCLTELPLFNGQLSSTTVSCFFSMPPALTRSFLHKQQHHI